MPTQHEDDSRFDQLGARISRTRSKLAARLSNAEGRKLVNAKALESSVQAAICDYLDAQRIQYARTDATESFNRKGQRVKRVDEGWPDITACLKGDGKLIGIECKRAVGGKLSYEQAYRLDRLWQDGALVVVARSVDDLISLLATKRTSVATVAEIIAALKKGPKLKRGNRR